MDFNNNEKLAIIRILEKIAKADDKIVEEEMQVLLKAAGHLHVGKTEIEESKEMALEKASHIIKSMGKSKQEFVNTLLLKLMASDGSIDEKEVRILMETYLVS